LKVKVTELLRALRKQGVLWEEEHWKLKAWRWKQEFKIQGT
jgi:hypothetical protein